MFFTKIPHFVWSAEYSIGIAALDEQHQHLFMLMNRLYALDHAEDDRGDRRLQALLEEFNEYAAFHFLTEERLMRDHLAADTDQARHHAEHRGYWQAIEDYRQRFARQEAGVAHDLLAYLDHWWRHHILATDRQFGSQLQHAGFS
ncbi:MAG: bacteriohemerythrin [Sterolibacterium sp.]|jgi:hemerythrin|nr:bacteriohemerythrin [Sterolibacterium sp.]